MNFIAVIVAGGKGTRISSTLPKQFLQLNEKPVLMHTIQAFLNSNYKPEIVLVLAKADMEIWRSLCEEFNFHVPHRLVEGGAERFFSVKNAITTIENINAIIAIHDAARPLVSHKLIDCCFEEALKYGNAVPCVKVSESVRELKGNKNNILNRDTIVLVQTPQTFQATQLVQAYQQEFRQAFTDDASVVEQEGYPINLIEGERKNLKITFEEDLKLAAFYLKN